ncbi:MAG: hypothetical protein HY286_17935 [Planctomycetes bacterium]|nr:hypothetical protein [Planctomycetota bacterium]
MILPIQILIAAIALTTAALAPPVSAQSDPVLRNATKLGASWQARFDDTNNGFVQGFTAGGGSESTWLPVSIPTALERLQPFAGRNGTFWLRTKLTIPALPDPDHRLRLQFARVVESCKVFCNGTEVGAHDCGDTPFFVDITAAAVPGENLIVVQLDDTFVGMPPEMLPWGGICGDVELQTVSFATVEDITVRRAAESGSGAVEISAHCENSGITDDEFQLKFEIAAQGNLKILASASMDFTIPAGKTAVPKALLNVPGLELWSLEKPALYQVSARLLKNGVPFDAQSRTTGFRDIKISAARITINGSAVRIRGVSDYGYEAESLLTPSKLFEPERKIKLLKEAGFNAIMARGRQPLRELVDAANAQGMLIFEFPALRKIDVKWRPALFGPLGMMPVPTMDFVNIGDATLQILERQIRRDADDPSVVWFGFPDVTKKTARRAHELAPGCIVSRDAVASGKNYYYNPGAGAAEYYLRSNLALECPFGEAGRNRLLGFGDRDELAFATISAGFGTSDLTRAINGLGGDEWREESRVYAPWLEKLNISLGGELLKKAFPSFNVYVEQMQSAHATWIRHAVEAARSNVKLGILEVAYLIDSPAAFGEGLFDTLGRPKKEYVECARANVARRCVAMPRRYSGEVPRLGSYAEGYLIDCAEISDTKEPPPFIIVVETARPDKLNGETQLRVSSTWASIKFFEISCNGGEGLYTINPVYTELKSPQIETEYILGVRIPNSIFGNKVQNVTMAPHIAFLGSTESIANEDRFLQIIDALEIARDGGTVVVANALTPGDPLVNLQIFEGLSVAACADAAHVALDERPFGGIAPKGVVREPMNEALPRYCMNSVPKGADIFGVSIDRNGAVLGADMIQIPFGKGAVILTTYPLAERFLDDPASRKILSNIGDIAAALPAPKGDVGGDAKDRAQWLARFRALTKKP